MQTVKVSPGGGGGGGGGGACDSNYIRVRKYEYPFTNSFPVMTSSIIVTSFGKTSAKKNFSHIIMVE